MHNYNSSYFVQQQQGQSMYMVVTRECL